MINSNFVACCTGRSAGFLPFEHPTGIDPDPSEGILRNQVAPARATWRDFSRVAGTLGLLRLMICATNSLLNRGAAGDARQYDLGLNHLRERWTKFRLIFPFSPQ